jgi:ABC-type dipeptide/oligopeptide/nickel transport system permease component
VVTFAGIYFAILVTTAIVVETVFAWPGSGGWPTKASARVIFR